MNLVKESVLNARVSDCDLVSEDGSIIAKKDVICLHIDHETQKDAAGHSDPLFVSRGVSYWKDGTLRFASHEASSFHQEAMQVILRNELILVRCCLSKTHILGKQTENAY